MMRRTLALLRRDLRSQTRDFMIVYLILAPFLLALVLRAFIPSVGAASINLAVPESIGSAMVAKLGEYGDVEVLRDRSAVESRVLQLDDIAGIVPEGDSYAVILEGNETDATAELPALVLAHILAPTGTVGLSEIDLGRVASPLLPFALAFVPLMGVMVGGLLIGFSIVEEKEDNVVSALGVSPMSRFEYILGRSLIGVVLGLLLAIPPIYVLGIGSIDVPKIAVITLGATFTAVILGLYIGAVAGNQIEAIGVLKLAALPFSIGPLLLFFLSDKWQWTLYWIPTYWTVRGYKAIFVDGQGWSEALQLTAISLAVGFVFLALSWRFLNRRLTMRG